MVRMMGAVKYLGEMIQVEHVWTWVVQAPASFGYSIKPPAMQKSHGAVFVDVSDVSPFVLTTCLARSRRLRL